MSRAGEPIEEFSHGSDLHLESRYVILGFFQNHRQRFLPAAGNEAAEDFGFPLDRRQVLRLQPENAHPGPARSAGGVRRRVAFDDGSAAALEPEAARGEDRAAPARAATRGGGECSVGGVADSSAVLGDVAEGFEEPGRVAPLLSLRFPIRR